MNRAIFENAYKGYMASSFCLAFAASVIPETGGSESHDKNKSYTPPTPEEFQKALFELLGEVDGVSKRQRKDYPFPHDSAITMAKDVAEATEKRILLAMRATDLKNVKDPLLNMSQRTLDYKETQNIIWDRIKELNFRELLSGTINYTECSKICDILNEEHEIAQCLIMRVLCLLLDFDEETGLYVFNVNLDLLSAMGVIAKITVPEFGVIPIPTKQFKGIQHKVPDAVAMIIRGFAAQVDSRGQLSSGTAAAETQSIQFFKNLLDKYANSFVKIDRRAIINKRKNVDTTSHYVQVPKADPMMLFKEVSPSVRAHPEKLLYVFGNAENKTAFHGKTYGEGEIRVRDKYYEGELRPIIPAIYVGDIISLLIRERLYQTGGMAAEKEAIDEELREIAFRKALTEEKVDDSKLDPFNVRKTFAEVLNDIEDYSTEA